MSTVTYNSEFDYIEGATSLKARLTRIRAISAQLETTLLKAAVTDNIDEYWLDDGQTKIKTIYRSVGAITKGLEALDAFEQRLINRLTGRVVRLVDEKNFR